MSDFELPESFDNEPEPTESTQDGGLDGFLQMEEDEPLPPPEPIYVEPQGMEAFGAIAESTNALDDFNKEWQGKINEKAAAEVKLASDSLTAAQAELDNWHQQRTNRLSKKKDINRQEEAVVKSGLAADCEDKAAWARVLKLVNTTDAAVAGKADLARMQKILIQLKNDPMKTK